MNTKPIIIVGAGLCGSLLAIRLAQRGFNVKVYERRSDLRIDHVDAGRSINLALSARGLLALKKAGIEDEILEDCIPMRGRMIHPLGGEKFLSKYSGRSEDYINSVSRPGLNKALLQVADRHDNAEFFFDCKVTDIDVKQATITYVKDGEIHTVEGEIVLGTDGAGSIVRRTMMAKAPELDFDYSQEFLSHGYKELSILPADNGDWKIHKEALHIWPRGEFMVIALPNLDGSFTLTMFHPYEGEAGFNTLDTAEKVTSFFEKYYPGLLPYIPHLETEYFENPVGKLGTIRCYPWMAYGKTLIMGDAAHAIVPFYGQGMNASLEDVRVFDALIEEFGTDWDRIFSIFQEERKINADAIADLAIDNFHEMQDRVDDEDFKRKRKIEMQLEQTYPKYYSKYSLVTFRPELTYNHAMVQGRAQDETLLKMVTQEGYEELDLQEYFDRLKVFSTRL